MDWELAQHMDGVKEQLDRQKMQNIFTMKQREAIVALI